MPFFEYIGLKPSKRDSLTGLYFIPGHAIEVTPEQGAQLNRFPFVYRSTDGFTKVDNGVVNPIDKIKEVKTVGDFKPEDKPNRERNVKDESDPFTLDEALEFMRGNPDNFGANGNPKIAIVRKLVEDENLSLEVVRSRWEELSA